MIKLSILIATVIDRRHLFEPLYAEFQRQAKDQPVEILYLEDNKEISVGKKRQRLLEMATGEYIAYFDSDDWPREYYVYAILNAIKNAAIKPDCVGFSIRMTTNGQNEQTCIHSLKYKVWEFKDGKYLRGVTHFNPVRRELALQVGFPDLRFGEDKVYSDGITPLCKTEAYIGLFLFDYRYTTHEPHNKKYGIK